MIETKVLSVSVGPPSDPALDALSFEQRRLVTAQELHGYAEVLTDDIMEAANLIRNGISGEENPSTIAVMHGRLFAIKEELCRIAEVLRIAPWQKRTR